MKKAHSGGKEGRQKNLSAYAQTRGDTYQSGTHGGLRERELFRHLSSSLRKLINDAIRFFRVNNKLLACLGKHGENSS